ncbi:L-seryl-tRNA(Sec) kinase [Chanos chanos]|uniref:L-seryl-tRNA(Sec) kinase n=1 Tax=Chanos chanos TaxID=29144 RepID=A0A6J2VI37_CHACN|nr:L-seryl-tRNA(Sec) kinase [Chanos chanos]
MDAHPTLGTTSSHAVCLCVLCGLPAAGKSTLAQVISTHIFKQDWGTFVLSYDELISEDAFSVDTSKNDDTLPNAQTKWRLHRQTLLSCLDWFLGSSAHTSVSSDREGEVWLRFYSAVQKQNVLTACENSHALPSRLLVLLDDNFYYQSMRYEVCQLARKHSVGFCQVYLQCSLELCLGRNQRRNQPLPDAVLLDMSKRMEPPNPNKNPWEQRSLTLHSTDHLTEKDIEKFMHLISSAVENPLSPTEDNSEQREADKQACASSVVHQADQTCRRLVSKAMQTARENTVSSESMKVLAKELNELKTRFLQDLRKQILHDLPVSAGEPLDVEGIVNRAVRVFNQERDDILLRHGINSEAKTM